MKVVILGAGRVGSTVAESLAGEANDITIVDIDPERLRLLQDRLDLRTVAGNASHPEILRQAGAQDADMILAVTQNDETNLVACKLASILFNIPTKIARIRASDYLSHPEIFTPENFSVDFTICPEQILTDYIVKLIDFPEALQVLDFADGKVNLVGVRASPEGSLVDQELQNLKKHMPNTDSRVAAIFRKGRAIMPERDTIIEAGDEVFFIAAAKDIRMVMSELKRMDKPIRRIMIAGGGNIGSRLAKSIERDHQVKLIEYNKKACEALAAQLSKTLILHGDATDEALFEAENVDEMDLFCALTNDDENNIMAALLAKRMGARKVIALINRSVYVDLVQGGEIDIAISPSQATIGTLLTHVRRADVTAVHSLRRGAAEALELVAHGDAKSSKVVGRRVDEVDLPPGVSIGAIVRDTQVLIAHRETVIEQDDHVIVFAINKELIPKVEKLFQVAVGFF